MSEHEMKALGREEQNEHLLLRAHALCDMVCRWHTDYFGVDEEDKDNNAQWYWEADALQADLDEVRGALDPLEREIVHCEALGSLRERDVRERAASLQLPHDRLHRGPCGHPDGGQL